MTGRWLLSGFFLLWELPQNIAGLFFRLIASRRKILLNTGYRDHRLVLETLNTGVSLGWFVFYSRNGNRFPGTEDCLLHELGHSRQSRMLGPAYLILVGIPSLLRVWYSWYYRRKHRRAWEGYFNGYPENWADRLGGVPVTKA